jgi:hypothetical protein
MLEEARCGHCGAPLETTPDSVVAVCRFCGAPSFLMGNPAEVLAVPTLPGPEVARRAVERTRSDPDLQKRLSAVNFATSPDLHYLPFYFVEGTLNADYKAAVLVIYTERSRSGTQIMRRTVRVSGRVSLTDAVGVLARRAPWGLSADELAKHFLSSKPKPKPLSHLAAQGEGSFLAAEITPERAKAKAVKILISRLLKRVEQDAAAKAKEAAGLPNARTVVQDKAVSYEVARLEASRLTYLPLWVMTYLYDGSYYHYYLAGWDGRVVVAEEPVFAEHRRASLLSAVAAGGLGGMGLALTPQDFFMGAAVLIGGAVLSYTAAGNMLKSRRVEK